MRKFSLAAVLALLAPGAAWAADVLVTDGSGADITLTMDLDDSISLTIGGRTNLGTIINDGPGLGTVNFGSVTIDSAPYAGPTVDLHKHFHSADGSATFRAQLNATVYYSGATTVALTIEGTAPTDPGVSGQFLCNNASGTWSGPNPPTHSALGTDTTCHTFATAGVATTIPVDLALNVTPVATGNPTGTFLFTTVAAAP